MSLREVLRALRRNAVVIVLLLALTSGASAFVWLHVPVTYQSQSTMIVLLPNVDVNATAHDPARINPYLSVGALSAQVAASALANVSSSDEFLAALHRAGVTSTPTVVVTQYGGGVVLQLTAVDPVAPAATRDVARISKQLAVELQRRQIAAGAPDGTFMTVTDLTEPSSAVAIAGNRTKLAAIAALIGLVVTVAVTVFLDARRMRNGRAVDRTELLAAAPSKVRSSEPSPPAGEWVAPEHLDRKRVVPEPVGATSARGGEHTGGSPRPSA